MEHSIHFYCCWFIFVDMYAFYTEKQFAIINNNYKSSSHGFNSFLKFSPPYNALSIFYWYIIENLFVTIRSTKLIHLRVHLVCATKLLIVLDLSKDKQYTLFFEIFNLRHLSETSKKLILKFVI